MRNILFVDDEYERHNWINFLAAGKTISIRHAYDADEAEEAFKQGPWSAIFLDHDLGEKKDGTYLAEVLTQTGYQGIVYIHSFNPVGAQRMYKILTAAKIKALIVNIYDKDETRLNWLKQ